MTKEKLPIAQVLPGDIIFDSNGDPEEVWTCLVLDVVKNPSKEYKCSFRVLRLSHLEPSQSQHGETWAFRRTDYLVEAIKGH